MANMAHCRMENTYYDLLDCYEHILDMHPESSEQEYFFKLVALCKKIAMEGK